MTCRSCQKPITWARTAQGKAIPLDVEPVANGNLLLLDGVVRPLKAEDARPNGKAHISHFATCPNAAAHRRPR